MNDQCEHSNLEFIHFSRGSDMGHDIELDCNQLPELSPFSTVPLLGYGMGDIKSNQKRFCNMFQTQKFCEWLRYEWLYSSIDREIFLGFNDFQLILRENLPSLKTRNLTRSQWSAIRRIIGRPRRFSQTFLLEERSTVQERRKNMQYLQHFIFTSLLGPMASEHIDSLLNCLPSMTRIPPRLPPGTRVCVNFYTPVKGLYLGVIQDSYLGDGHYAVWIEEPALSHINLKSKFDLCGLHLVPDDDIYPLPNQTLPSSLSLSEIRYHFKENIIGSTAYPNSRLTDTLNGRSDLVNHSLTSAGPLLSESICTLDCPLEITGGPDINVDGILVSQTKPENVAPVYPGDPVSLHNTDQQAHTKFLINLCKIYNILDNKRSSVHTMKQLNDTAEVKISEDCNSITVQFQHSYATLVLHLDKLNQELKYRMDEVLLYVSAMAQEHNMMSLNYITDWRRRCDDEAQEMVTRIKSSQGRPFVNDGKLDLVAKLSSLLIHLCNLSEIRSISQGLASIDDVIKEIRQCIHPNNLKCFESTVEHFVGQIINALTNTAHSRTPPCPTNASLNPENPPCM